jgi:hypothetical protein
MLKTIGGFPGGHAVNYGIDRPQSKTIEKFAREAGNDDSFKEYRDEIRRADGSYNRHHGSNDSGYVEFNRSNYAEPYGKMANRHEREILDAGGLRTSSGSILFQDPFQQERSFEKLRNTLITKPKPNRAKRTSR